MHDFFIASVFVLALFSPVAVATIGLRRSKI